MRRQVSVLLPARDAETTLPEAIASLEAQTLADFEVVAVDDGSADDTGTLLDAWAGRDARVRVLRHPEPRGVVEALERARAAARAPYLARMDADDVALPGRLEAQLALMESDPTLTACGCGVAYFPREAVRGGARRYEAWLNGAVTPAEIERALFVECPLPHPTFFLRADAVARVGGYRDRGWAEDWDLLLRLWAAGGRLGKVPEVLLRWREGEARLSRTHPRYAPEAFLACRVHHLVRTVLRGRPGVVIWGAGPVGKALSRALATEGVRVEAFVELDPRKIGQAIHGAPVLDTEAALAAAVRAPGAPALPHLPAPPAADEAEGATAPYHLAAVGQAGARARIEALLENAGLRPVHDFAAVA